MAFYFFATCSYILNTKPKFYQPFEETIKSIHQSRRMP